MKWFLLALALPLAACAGHKPMPGLPESQCLAMADNLKTLKKGDPLPRVREVMGVPSREYRTTSTFGGKYDVLEYDTGDTPCTRYLLDSPHKLVLMFDTKGQFIGHGSKRFLPLRGATSNRVKTGAW